AADRLRARGLGHFPDEALFREFRGVPADRGGGKAGQPRDGAARDRAVFEDRAQHRARARASSMDGVPRGPMIHGLPPTAAATPTWSAGRSANPGPPKAEANRSQRTDAESRRSAAR